MLSDRTRRDFVEAVKEKADIRDLARNVFKMDLTRQDKISCPFHNEKTPSCQLHKDYFKCFGCEAGGDVFEFVQRLRAKDFNWTLDYLAEFYSVSKKDQNNGHKPDWRKIWADAISIDKPLAEPVRLYFSNRGLSLTSIPQSLRFHSSLKHWDANGRSSTFPGLIGRVTLPDNTGIGVHRIYLTFDGRKAYVDTPKKSLGQTNKGGGIYLDATAEVSNVCEGIEKALAIREATSISTIAAVSASALGNLQLPEEIKELYIWADRDEAGQTNAKRLASRAAQAGRKSFIFTPRIDGDWHDVFIHQGASALQAELEREIEAFIPDLNDLQDSETGNIEVPKLWDIAKMSYQGERGRRKSSD